LRASRLPPRLLHKEAHSAPSRKCSGDGLKQTRVERPGALKQIGQVAALMRGYRRPIATTVALTLVAACLAALEPILLKRIIDGLTDTPSLSHLRDGVLLLCGVWLLKMVIDAIGGVSRWMTQVTIEYDLRSRTMRRVHTLPVSFHQGQQVGALMTRLDRGIGQLVAAVGTLAFSTLPSVAFLITALWIMQGEDWRLALVLGLFAPIPAIIGVLAAREQSERERKLLNGWSAIYSRLNEVLSGIRTVKAFGMEKRELGVFLRGVRGTNRTVRRGIVIDTTVSTVKEAVSLLARAATIGFGGWLVIRGETTLGTVIAFLGYIGSVFGPVEGLTGIYATLRKASAALEVVQMISDAPEDPADDPQAVPLSSVRGEVHLRDVHFSYDGQTQILSGLDVQIAAGETVAIVGGSGAGKTTIASLVQRLYDPQQGAVLIDGRDIRDYKQASLRQHIGVVLQDGLIFRDSVRANIAYGCPTASMEEIEAAAKAAHAHEFITEQLPDGYDTDVGERGSLLSAGQRQRIAIARTLLKDPRILILDEATSALDAESEAKVQAALMHLMEGRTTIVIAHRLATITCADRIVVLGGGRVQEQGTHAELMSRAGYYARLVGFQTAGLGRPAATVARFPAPRDRDLEIAPTGDAAATSLS
jgi:ATP-binding cassette, subfamily B, bacterial